MPLNNNLRIDNEWDSYANISYHTKLFKKGIVVVFPSNNKEQSLQHKIVDAEHFSINDRNFFFDCIKTEHQTRDSSAVIDKVRNKNAIRACSILEQLACYGSEQKLPLSAEVIYNQKHREEVFIPFSFSSKKATALYVYPWLSQNSPGLNLNFQGFEQFVTAGCLFGSSLRGMDQKGAAFPLIKHNIEFFEGQKIQAIIVDEEINNPYEMMLLEQFKQYACFIENFAVPDKPKSLLYHLPYYDYILFGIELYLNNRITQDAFIKLVDTILNRKNRHEVAFGKICAKHSIEVVFESPFENLFGSSFSDITGKAILEKIDATLSLLKNADTAASAGIKEEKKFVDWSLIQLAECKKHPLQQHIWKDFIALSDQSKLDSIESLFKIANAVMIARATYNRQAYKVCSLLPLSEKQIQVNYAGFCKKMRNGEMALHYPAITNITTLDNLITYGPLSSGLPFYFMHCLETLADFITEEKTLKKACKNVGKFFAASIKSTRPTFDEADCIPSSPRKNKLL